VWTGCRETVPGTGPRETSASHDHDGFAPCQPCAHVRCDIDAVPYASSGGQRSLPVAMAGWDQQIDAAHAMTIRSRTSPHRY
jgi:hypothetical protein